MGGHHGRAVKGREVPGRVRPKLVADEAGDVAQFPGAVVAAGDEQGRDFQPPAEPFDDFQVVQHGLEPAAAIFVVKFLRKRLEVDIGRIDAPAQGQEKILGHEAVAHEDDLEAPRLGLPGGLIDLFEKDRRLVVGEGDARRLLRRQAGQRVGRGAASGYGAPGAHMGDLVILAVAAMEVAARAADGIRLCPRQKMVERLFFYRVKLDGGDDIPGQGDHFAAHVDAHAATPMRPLLEAAGVRAQIAAERPVRFPIPKHGTHF